MYAFAKYRLAALINTFIIFPNFVLNSTIMSLSGKILAFSFFTICTFLPESFIFSLKSSKSMKTIYSVVYRNICCRCTSIFVGGFLASGRWLIVHKSKSRENPRNIPKSVYSRTSECIPQAILDENSQARGESRTFCTLYISIIRIKAPLTKMFNKCYFESIGIFLPRGCCTTTFRHIIFVNLWKKLNLWQCLYCCERYIQSWNAALLKIGGIFPHS